jgi:flagellar basal-body rod protein FlgB
VNLVPRYDSIDFNAAALRLRSQRQEVLASNLANADTPAYQARDIDFSRALQEHMQGVTQQGRLQLALSHGQHLDRADAGRGGPSLLYRSALQPSVDGNTVDPDVERAHFAENTVGFELATALLGRAVKSRQMAITGQP